MNDTTAGFFLEVDTGTEPLTKLVGKLDKYAELRHRGGPSYPVLFWLHSEQREEHLHRLSPSRAGDVLVATATHATDPAKAVWIAVGATTRVRLTDLPGEHGKPVAENPNFDRNGQLLF